MLLDLTKAFSFFACILMLYQAAIHAFFVPGTHWRERLLSATIRLLFALCVCYLSGILFALPVQTNPDRNKPITRTLPVQLYFWSLAAISVFFVASWYLSDLAQQCGPFINSHTLEKF